MDTQLDTLLAVIVQEELLAEEMTVVIPPNPNDPFQKLSDEVIMVWLSHVRVSDLFTLRVVCRRFHALFELALNDSIKMKRIPPGMVMKVNNYVIAKSHREDIDREQELIQENYRDGLVNKRDRLEAVTSDDLFFEYMYMMEQADIVQQINAEDEMLSDEDNITSYVQKNGNVHAGVLISA